MNACLDEGTLQAYLDGELSPETSNDAATHLAACHTCAEAARAAEQELALFSTAFAPAVSAAVPTEKLRARLDEAIAGLNATGRSFAQTSDAPSRLRSYFDSLVAALTNFTPRQATAFASFIVAVALVLVFALMQTPDSPDAPDSIAKLNRTTAPASAVVVPTDNGATRNNDDRAAVQTPAEEIDLPAPARASGGDGRASFVKAELSVRPRASRARAAERVGGSEAPDMIAAGNTNAAAAITGEPLLADEKTYLSSISSLTSAIEAQGAEGMTPTLRAEYERNLAVVNQAIVSSRVAARRNPQDTDAKEFLRAAYQNKVELLSAVADQTQLASSRD